MYDIKTSCEEMIEKYGENNVFMISRSYRSYVDDDYCSFWYWNNVTHEVFEDSWATAYACPSYSRFECMWLKDGIERGLVDEKAYIDHLKNEANALHTEHWAEGIIATWFQNLRQDHDVFVPANVYRGRKFRGECILVRRICVKSGDYTLDHGVVYDACSNQLHEVTYSNVSIDTGKMVQPFLGWVKERTDACSTLKEWENCNVKFGDWLAGCIESNAINLEGVPYPEKEERERKEKYYAEKRESFRERKMQELIEWAKNVKPHLTDSERLSFVERVYNRKYETI